MIVFSESHMKIEECKLLHKMENSIYAVCISKKNRNLMYFGGGGIWGSDVSLKKYNFSLQKKEEKELLLKENNENKDRIKCITSFLNGFNDEILIVGNGCIEIILLKNEVYLRRFCLLHSNRPKRLFQVDEDMILIGDDCRTVSFLDLETAESGLLTEENHKSVGFVFDEKSKNVVSISRENIEFFRIKKSDEDQDGSVSVCVPRISSMETIVLDSKFQGDLSSLEEKPSSPPEEDREEQKKKKDKEESGVGEEEEEVKNVKSYPSATVKSGDVPKKEEEEEIVSKNKYEELLKSTELQIQKDQYYQEEINNLNTKNQMLLQENRNLRETVKFERSLLSVRFKKYKFAKDENNNLIVLGGKSFGKQGVNGVIYVVEAFGRKLAMKVIINMLSTQSTLLQSQFINTEFLYKLPLHKNLCRIHHCFIHKLLRGDLRKLEEEIREELVQTTTAFFIMPLYDCSLSGYLEKNRNHLVNSEIEMLKFMRDVLTGVDILH